MRSEDGEGTRSLIGWSAWSRLDGCGESNGVQRSGAERSESIRAALPLCSQHSAQPRRRSIRFDTHPTSALHCTAEARRATSDEAQPGVRGRKQRKPGPPVVGTGEQGSRKDFRALRSFVAIPSRAVCRRMRLRMRMRVRRATPCPDCRWSSGHGDAAGGTKDDDCRPLHRPLSPMPSRAARLHAHSTTLHVSAQLQR